jgi:hypothetical protein
MSQILNLADTSYSLRNGIIHQICRQKFTLPILKDLKEVITLTSPSASLMLLRGIAESGISAKLNYLVSMLEKMVKSDMNEVALEYAKAKKSGSIFRQNADFVEECYVMEAEAEAQIAIKELAYWVSLENATRSGYHINTLEFIQQHPHNKVKILIIQIYLTI